MAATFSIKSIQQFISDRSGFAVVCCIGLTHHQLIDTVIKTLTGGIVEGVKTEYFLPWPGTDDPVISCHCHKFLLHNDAVHLFVSQAADGRRMRALTERLVLTLAAGTPGTGFLLLELRWH